MKNGILKGVDEIIDETLKVTSSGMVCAYIKVSGRVLVGLA